jgi:nicotinamidase-related amidase
MKPLGISPSNRWRVSAEAVDLVRDTQVEQSIQIPASPQSLRLDLARTAIVVVDMQNDFCHPDGWLASIGVDIAPARTPIAPLQALLPVLREQDVPVIWLNWGNRPYNPTGDGIGLGDPLPRNGAPVLQEGSWAAAIVDELAPSECDIRISKYRMSGFWDTPLDSILRNLRVTTLLFAGVNLDQCVMCTLQDANCLGYDCILLEDGCATTSPDFCTAATLYNVKQCFGFVASTSDLVLAINSRPLS